MSKLFSGLRILVSLLVTFSIGMMFVFSIVGALFVYFFSNVTGVTAVDWVKFGTGLTRALHSPIWALLSSLYFEMLVFVSIWFVVKISISVFFPNVDLEKVFDDFLYKSGKKELVKSE